MLAPPYSSGTVMPSTPSSPILRHRSIGNWSLRSISAARGAISACGEGAHRVAQRVDVFAELEVEAGQVHGVSPVDVGSVLDAVAAGARPSACALMVATSFSLPSSMAQARPSATLMVRPGLMTRPSMRKRWPCAGASRLILNSMVSTAGVGRHQAEAGVAAGRIERRGDHAGVQEAVLLGQRLRPGQLDHDPARRRPRPACAPMVSIAAWRSKLARTRAAKSGSCGFEARVGHGGLLELTFT